MKKAKKTLRMNETANLPDLEKKFAERDETLHKLVNIFYNKPDFDEYSDIKI